MKVGINGFFSIYLTVFITQEARSHNVKVTRLQWPKCPHDPGFRSLVTWNYFKCENTNNLFIWEPQKPKIEDILVKNGWAFPVLDSSFSHLKAVLKVVNILMAYFKWMEAIIIHSQSLHVAFQRQHLLYCIGSFISRVINEFTIVFFKQSKK